MKTIYFLFLMICVSCVQSKNSSVIKGGTSLVTKAYFACMNQNENATSSAELIALTNQGTVVSEIVYYDQPGCQVANAYQRDFFYGTYRYESSLSKMTIKYNRLNVAYLTSAEVDARNTAGECGFNDWRINILKDITDNEDCTEGVFLSDSPEIVYDNAVLNDSIYKYGTTTYNRVNF